MMKKSASSPLQPLLDGNTVENFDQNNVENFDENNVEKFDQKDVEKLDRNEVVKGKRRLKHLGNRTQEEEEEDMNFVESEANSDRDRVEILDRLSPSGGLLSDHNTPGGGCRRLSDTSRNHLEAPGVSCTRRHSSDDTTPGPSRRGSRRPSDLIFGRNIRKPSCTPSATSRSKQQQRPSVVVTAPPGHNYSETPVDFDDLLPFIGEMGRYQMVFYLLMCIPTMPAAFLAFNQVFLSAEPTHWCRVSAFDHHNISLLHRLTLSIPRRDLGPGLEDVVAFQSCSMYDVNFTQLFEEGGGRWPEGPAEDWAETECREGWEYDRSEYADTLVTELDLVCDRNWWPSTSTALFYVGSLFGNIIFGKISDNYGRRTSFFALLFMSVGLAIVTSFSPNYVVFTVLRTINGFTFPALFQIPFIMTLEIMGPGYRTFAGMMICLFFAVALMILAGLAYVFNSWFHLALVTSVPFVTLFSYWWFVPESPRWLLSYGRIDEAEVIIQNMAKWNGKQIGPNFVRDFIEQKKQQKLQQQHLLPRNSCCSAVSHISTNLGATTTPLTPHRSTHKPSMLVLLLHYPVARCNFMLITFNWLANALVYNGLSFYSANLNVNSFLGFFISSAVEIPSYFVGWYAMDKWGRRWILFATMTTGGIAGICCIFVPLDASPWITVTLAMIGKFQIAASFAVIYVYAGELMPTVVRSEAMGISSFVAGIGLLIFPYINSLGSYSHVLPLVIMGVLSVWGGVSALFLPETLWTHLPNTLEEGEEFGSDFKICSCPHKKQENLEDAIIAEEETVPLNDLKGSQEGLPNGKLSGHMA